jgi:hypothetical protein
VYVNVSGSEIRSSGATLQVTGTGGGTGISGFNFGILVKAGAITAGAAGTTVDVSGTGGAGTGGNHRGISVEQVTAVISSGGGNLTVTGTPGTGGVGNLALRIDPVAEGTISTPAGGGAITLIGDSMELGNSGTTVTDNGNGGVTIRQQTAAVAIDLGSAVDTTASTLELSDTELDRVSATTLNIGNASSGAVTVSAPISHGNNLTISVASAITFNQSVTMAVDKSLSVTTTSTASGILLPTTNSDLSASGTGTISLTAARNINMASGSSVTTVDGDLTLSANQQVTPTSGNFAGVDMISALVQVTGSGAISVLAKGGTDLNGSQYGIRLGNGADILGGTSGTVTVTGTGGGGTGGGNQGVRVEIAGSSISSSGGNVVVTGTGGGSVASDSNFGVWVLDSGLITCGGSGTVTVTGTGGNGSGGSQHGVLVQSGGDILGGTTGTLTISGTGGLSGGTQNVGVRVDGSGSTISSSGANVQVTGNGGGSGASIQNIGVFVLGSGAAISAGGTGTVGIIGNGGTTTTGDQNHGIVVQAAVSSNNGNITLNGTGGGSGTSGINRGVQIGSTASTSIAAGGANAVSLTGTGGSGGASTGNNQGVMILASGGLTTSVTTAGGTMTINGTPGGATTHGIDIQGGGTSTTVSTGGGNLTLIADGMSFSSTALSLNAGAGSATLRQLNNGTAINLGAADAAGTLGLTDAELDYFTASTVNIGDANSGAVTVSAPITHGNNLIISVASAITFNQAVTMALDKNLTVATTSTASGISLGTANSDLAASGTGTISLTTTRSIAFASGSSVTTVNGALTLTANAGGTGTGNFAGVSADGATTVVESTGSGNVVVTGRGGDTGANNYGVYVNNGAKLRTTGTGTVTVNGTGGAATGNDNYGVYVNVNGSEIRSSGATLQVMGTGGGTGISGFNFGILVKAGAITAGAAGTTVDVSGTGGTGTGGNHRGISVEQGTAVISSGGGSLTVTGTPGTGGVGNLALRIDPVAEGTISTPAGGGAITLIGDSMELGNSGTTVTDNGNGGVTIRQQTAAVAIDLGSAVDTTAGTLELSDTELDRVSATTLNIGDANTGAVTVSAPITHGNSVNMENGSANSIAFNNTFTLSAGKNLSVDSGSGGITINTTAIDTSATGSQTYQDPVSLTAGPTLTASTVTFESTVDGAQALTITGNAVFGDGGADAVGGATPLTTVSVSGTTTFNSASDPDVRTTGAQTYTGAATLGAATTLTSTTAGEIRFGSTVNGNFALAVNTTGDTRFQGIVGGLTPVASVTTDAGGAGVTRIETTAMTAQGGTLTFNDPVVLTTDTVLSDTGGTGIAFNSTVNSDGTPRSLTVSTSNGAATIQFNNAVGNLSPLNQVTINNAGAFQTLAAADFNLDGAFSQAGGGAVNMSGDVTTTDDNITFNGAVTLTANVALNTGAGAGNISFNSTLNDDGVTSNRNLNLTAGTGTITFTGVIGGTRALQGLTVFSASSVSFNTTSLANNGLTVTATAITLSGNVSTDATATAGNVNLNGAITLGAATLTIDTDAATTDANISFGTLADNGDGSFRTLNLTAGTGTVTFTSTPAALNLEVDGTTAGTSHDRINVIGSVNLNNTVLTIPNSTIASSVGQSLTLISNDGADAVSGTFNGLAEGAYLSINGISFQVSYAGGDGNDVTLTEATQTQVTLVGGVLDVSDAVDTADDLTISVNGANVRVRDSAKILAAGPGTTQVDPNTVEAPLANVTVRIDVNGNGGSDSLTRNFTGGNITVPINWAGGAPAVAVGDTLVLSGGATFTLVTHTFASASDGSVAVTGNGLISYTGLEPVTDNLSATDRVFDFTGGAETITLADAAGANMIIDSTLGESVTFANPTTSITINAGSGDDTIQINSMDSDGPYAGSLTINGDAATDNIVIVSIAPTLSALTTDSETLAALPTLSIGAGGLSLTTTAGAITQAGATTLTVTGTTTLAAGAANNITLNNANNFSTVIVTSGNNVALTDSGAINLGTSTVSGSLAVTAGGRIDFTGAGATTVGATMNLTTTANGIDDSGAGTLAVTGVATLNATGAGNDITLDNNNNLTTVAVSNGNIVTLRDTVANLTLNSSTIANTLTVDVTTAGAVFTLAAGASTVTGTTTINADDMTITGTLSVNAGAGTINLRQFNAARPIDLGTDTAGSLGLTDTELDNISAGAINIGTTASGAVTISSGGITRAAATDLSVTTAANNNITFSGGTAALDANGGNITLTVSGTGAITSGGAATEILGGAVSLTSGSGGIGAAGNSITIDGSTLSVTTGGNADAHISEANTVELTSVSTGTGTSFLVSGTFTVAAANTPLTGKLDITGTLDQVASGQVFTGGNASDTVRVRNGGRIVIDQTGATPYATLFNSATATSRKPPTLDSGSTIDWEGAVVVPLTITVDLTAFENVNFNGAGPFALSADTTVTSATGTMSVNNGSRLNTASFDVIGAGNFTLENGGTLGISSDDANGGIAATGAFGNILVTGTRTFNAGGHYVYNGTLAQRTGDGLPLTITGSLTIDNAAGVTLNRSTAPAQRTTTAQLNLTSGRFFTFNGAANGRLTTQAVDGRVAGFVVGEYTREFLTAATHNHTFHVGDNSGNYTPFDVANLVVNTANATLAAQVRPDYNTTTPARHPNLTAPTFPATGWQPIAGLDPERTLRRYWTLIPSAAGAFGTYDPTVTFVAGDLHATPGDSFNQNPSRHVLRRYNNDGLITQWHATGGNSRTATTTSATGVQNFGDFTAGEQFISFFTLSHPNSVGEEINVSFPLTTVVRDYLGVQVLSGHVPLTLTYAARKANTTTAATGFEFDASSNGFADQPDSVRAGVNAGSVSFPARGTAFETVDIHVTGAVTTPPPTLPDFPTGLLEDLVIGNAPTAVLAGSAAQFNGSGYGITEDVSSFFTDESITVELWFNANATGGVIFDERGANNTQGFRASWIEAVPSGGNLAIRLRVWNLPPVPTTGLTIGTVAPGTWHHVALRYDKSLLRLEGFLDGIKINVFAIGDRTTPLEINASNPVRRDGIFFGLGLADDQHLGSGAAFSGQLDEVRIWNGARTDNQIMDNWNRTVDPASPGLVAYYKLDDGSGNVAADATSNGLDLSFINFTPTWVTTTGVGLSAAATTLTVEVGKTRILTLDGHDPEATGVLTAEKRDPVTGGGAAALTQFDNTPIGGGTVAVTDSQRRVKITGLSTVGSPFTFNYRVNNGIANSADALITVNVVAATAPPTIAAAGTIAPAAAEDTSPITITRDQIATALGAADPAPGPLVPLSFRVRAVTNGLLRINSTNVVANTTFIGDFAPTNQVDWFPPANANGIVDAFIVDAWDGAEFSANVGVVRVNLTAVNDNPVTQFVQTALDLNGTNQYLLTPNLSAHFTNETVTVEVWFKPLTNASGGLSHGVVMSERGQSSLSGWRNTTIEILPSGQVKGRVWGVAAINLGKVITNEWNHVIVRYDKAQLRLSGYLNRTNSATLPGGVATGDRISPAEDGRPEFRYDIGATNAQNLGSGVPFKGQIAEVRIWATARSDASIQSSYLGQNIVNEAGLAAWYKLDETPGPATTATDSSPFNVAATLFPSVAGPSFVNANPMIVRNTGDYVITLPAVDPENQSMTWVVDPAGLTFGGKLYHSFGGAAGPEITVPSALFAASGGKVVYRPIASGGGAGVESFTYFVQDSGGLNSAVETVTINVLAGTRLAAEFVTTGAGDAGLAVTSASVASSAGIGIAALGAARSTAGGGGEVTLASLVQITGPMEGAWFHTDETLTVTVAVSELLGPAARVEVYSGDTLLGAAAGTGMGQFGLESRGLAPGEHHLHAVAYDSFGTMIASPPVVVTLHPRLP